LICIFSAAFACLSLRGRGGRQGDTPLLDERMRRLPAQGPMYDGA
jgi:hypothetical protein